MLNSLHTRQNCWKSTSDMGFRIGQNVYKINAPPATFHVHVWKSVHACNTPTPTKKVSWYDIPNPTGSQLFWISSSFCHFQASYFNSSSYSFNQIIFKFGACNHKAFAMLNWEDLEFSSKGRDPGALTNLMFCHQTGSCCNSGTQYPICPKPHVFDKSPTLNTSKGQY